MAKRAESKATRFLAAKKVITTGRARPEATTVLVPTV